jgi:hypothetical protein
MGAKGLEFDHVSHRRRGLERDRADEPRLLNWLQVPREQGGDHLEMAPIRVRGGDDDEPDSINLYLRLLHRERARPNAPARHTWRSRAARRCYICSCIRP